MADDHKDRPALPSVQSFLDPEEASGPTEGPLTFRSSNVNDLLIEAMEKIRDQVIHADRVLLLLQEGKELSVKAAHGSKAASVVTSDKVSRAIIRRVRRTNRPLFITDALEDNGLAARGSIQEIGQRSVMCLPLKAESQVVGFVYLDSLSLVAAFTNAEEAWSNRLARTLGRRLEGLLPAHMQELERHLDRRLPGPRFRKRSVKEQELDFGITLIRKARSYPGNFQSLKPKPGLAPRRPRGFEKANFFRSLANMLAAGVPINRALFVLSEQTESTLAVLCSSLQDDVTSGQRLSSAMSRFPTVFSRVHLSLVAVGENTGSLDTLMHSLADVEERAVKTRGKLLSALAYPTIVVGMCLVGCLLAPPLFLNDFFQTLAGAGMQLPPLTQFVMAVSKGMWSPIAWLGAALLLALLMAVWRQARKSLKVRLGVEEMARSLPIVGPLFDDIYNLSFVRSLAVQLEAGLYLDKSIVLAAGTSGSLRLEAKSVELVESLKNGASLGFSLERAKVFPRLLVEFLKIGEETGSLSKSCRFVERMLTERTENTIEVAEAMFEPLAISFVGILVGIVALACMLPLVKMFEAFL